MPIYAVKRKFKTGRVAKTPVVCIEAVDEDEAWDIFGNSEIWAVYDQYTPFFLEEIEPDAARKWTVLTSDDVIDYGDYEPLHIVI